MPRPTRLLRAIGATVIWLCGDGPNSFDDPTGATRACFEEAGALAMVVRPDLYVAGAVQDLSELSALVAEPATTMSIRPSRARLG